MEIVIENQEKKESMDSHKKKIERYSEEKRVNNSNNFTFVDKKEESKEKLHKMYLEIDNSSHHSSVRFNLLHNIKQASKPHPMDSYRSGACSVQPPFTAIDTYRTTKDVVLADLDAAADSGLVSIKDKEFEVVPELHTFNKEEDEYNQDEGGPTTLISHLNDPNNEAIQEEDPPAQAIVLDEPQV